MTHLSWNTKRNRRLSLLITTRDTLWTRQDAANGRCEQCDVFTIVGPIETRREEREKERDHCCQALYSAAYVHARTRASSRFIFAAAATLSRRLARVTFYSLLPSRSGCVLLPPFPRVSPSHVHTHFISFTSFALLHPLPLAPLNPALFFLCLFFLMFLCLLSSFCLSFLFLPFAISFFLPDLSRLFFPSTSFPLSLFLQEFPSDPSPFYGVVAAPLQHSSRQHSPFKISADINSIELEQTLKMILSNFTDPHIFLAIHINLY